MARGLSVRGWGGVGEAEMGHPVGPRARPPAGEWRGESGGDVVGGTMAESGP